MLNMLHMLASPADVVRPGQASHGADLKQTVCTSVRLCDEMTTGTIYVSALPVPPQVWQHRRRRKSREFFFSFFLKSIGTML